MKSLKQEVSAEKATRDRAEQAEREEIEREAQRQSADMAALEKKDIELQRTKKKLGEAEQSMSNLNDEKGKLECELKQERSQREAEKELLKKRLDEAQMKLHEIDIERQQWQLAPTYQQVQDAIIKYDNLASVHDHSKAEVKRLKSQVQNLKKRALRWVSRCKKRDRKIRDLKEQLPNKLSRVDFGLALDDMIAIEADKAAEASTRNTNTVNTVSTESYDAENSCAQNNSQNVDSMETACFINETQCSSNAQVASDRHDAEVARTENDSDRITTMDNDPTSTIGTARNDSSSNGNDNSFELNNSGGSNVWLSDTSANAMRIINEPVENEEDIIHKYRQHKSMTNMRITETKEQGDRVHKKICGLYAGGSKSIHPERLLAAAADWKFLYNNSHQKRQIFNQWEGRRPSGAATLTLPKDPIAQIRAYQLRVKAFKNGDDELLAKLREESAAVDKELAWFQKPAWFQMPNNLAALAQCWKRLYMNTMRELEILDDLWRTLTTTLPPDTVLVSKLQALNIIEHDAAAVAPSVAHEYLPEAVDAVQPNQVVTALASPPSSPSPIASMHDTECDMTAREEDAGEHTQDVQMEGVKHSPQAQKNPTTSSRTQPDAGQHSAVAALFRGNPHVVLKTPKGKEVKQRSPQGYLPTPTSHQNEKPSTNLGKGLYTLPTPTSMRADRGLDPTSPTTWAAFGDTNGNNSRSTRMPQIELNPMPLVASGSQSLGQVATSSEEKQVTAGTQMADIPVERVFASDTSSRPNPTSGMILSKQENSMNGMEFTADDRASSTAPGVVLPDVSPPSSTGTSGLAVPNPNSTTQRQTNRLYTPQSGPAAVNAAVARVSDNGTANRAINPKSSTQYHSTRSIKPSPFQPKPSILGQALDSAGTVNKDGKQINLSTAQGTSVLPGQTLGQQQSAASNRTTSRGATAYIKAQEFAQETVNEAAQKTAGPQGRELPSKASHQRQSIATGISASSTPRVSNDAAVEKPAANTSRPLAAFSKDLVEGKEREKVSSDISISDRKKIEPKRRLGNPTQPDVLAKLNFSRAQQGTPALLHRDPNTNEEPSSDEDAA